MSKLRTVSAVVVAATVPVLVSVPEAGAISFKRYGTDNGLGGNVFVNKPGAFGVNVCAKGSGWIKDTSSGGRKATVSATTWLRRGTYVGQSCAGSGGTTGYIQGQCIHTNAAVFEDGLLADANSATGSAGYAYSSLTAGTWTAAYSGHGYKITGTHFVSDNWNGAASSGCSSSLVSGSWTEGFTFS